MEVHEYVRVDRVIVEVREVCLDHIENSKHYVGSGANRKIHSFHASKVHLHVRQVESNQQLMEAVPHLLGHEDYNTETYRYYYLFIYLYSRTIMLSLRIV